jgi:hypothetical protein
MKCWFYLGADDAQQFLQKRLFGIPFPREQRREAKEKYEERYTIFFDLFCYFYFYLVVNELWVSIK